MFKKLLLATSALTFSLSLVLPLDGHAKAQEVTLQAQQEVTYQTPLNYPNYQLIQLNNLVNFTQMVLKNGLLKKQ